MPRKEYHVVPHENGWAVKKNNASKSSACTSTKSDAVSKAKELSKIVARKWLFTVKMGKYNIPTAMATTRVHLKTRNKKRLAGTNL